MSYHTRNAATKPKATPKKKKAAPKAKPSPKKAPEMAPTPKAPTPKAPAPKKRPPVRRKKREPKIDYRKGPVKYANAKANSYKRQPTLLG
jgi:hypothetical protein